MMRLATLLLDGASLETTARRRQDQCHTLLRQHLLYHWSSHERPSLLSGLPRSLHLDG
jgi:hypothetical protein